MHDQYLEKIAEFVEPNSRILDLGCGDGTLLAYLKQKKNVRGYGVEIDFDSVLKCIKRGIPVFQGNIDEGLQEFANASFDYVILSQTLQQVHKPLIVLSEMVRVGKKGLVTFPNFAYWRIRFQLFFRGVSPVTSAIPYHWYDTPNIRVITIKNFRELCGAKQIKIVKETSLYKNKSLCRVMPRMLANLFSQQGLFILQDDK